MDLATFFSFELSPIETAFYKFGDLVEIGNGDVSYRLVGADKKDKALQLLRERYRPGADSGRIHLSHEGEEGGVIISGQLEVTVGDQKRVLGPGDAYYFDSRTPHRFRNIGDIDCEVVSACCPPSF